MHGLIEKIPKTNRYVVTHYGRHSCLYLTKVYSRLFLNGFGKVVDEQCDVECRPIRLAINRLDKAINDEIANENLAA